MGIFKSLKNAGKWAKNVLNKWGKEGENVRAEPRSATRQPPRQMITYHSPRTFCFLVTEHIAERGWKINRESFMSNLRLSLPGGLMVDKPWVMPSERWGLTGVRDERNSALLHAFVELCELYAKKHMRGIAYVELDAEEKKKRAEEKAKRQPKAPKYVHFTEFGEAKEPRGHFDFGKVDFDIKFEMPDMHDFMRDVFARAAAQGFDEEMAKEMARQAGIPVDEVDPMKAAQDAMKSDPDPLNDFYERKENADGSDAWRGKNPKYAHFKQKFHKKY